jgi:uncharacterized LabA/DUF88 family protein
MSSRANRIAVLIDGLNLHATSKTLGFDVDFKRLLTEFESRGSLLRAFYYTAIIEDQEYSSVRPLVDWLDYNGYTVVTEPTKEFIDASGRRKVKAKFDMAEAAEQLLAPTAWLPALLRTAKPAAEQVGMPTEEGSDTYSQAAE